MRITLVSERLSPPHDEGIKNTAYQLACRLVVEHDVAVVTAFARGVSALGGLSVRNVRTNKLFASLDMARVIQSRRPELILYIPTASATPFSFMRARALRLYAQGAPVVMLALQWRPYGRLARLIMPRIQPDLVLVQSRVTYSSLEPFGLRLGQLWPGIRLDRFRPLDLVERQIARQRLGLDLNAYVVLHVGHLNRGRNVQALLAVQRKAQVPNLQCLVVGSSSTDQDPELVAELRAGGVQVIAGYVEQIEQLYGLADCYLFPVHGRMSAIDLPLSVLEAMACDLAVVTTRFGGLVSLFQPAAGFQYVDTTEEMVAAVEACAALPAAGTRAMVAPYDWPNAARRILALIADELGLALPARNGRDAQSASES